MRKMWYIIRSQSGMEWMGYGLLSMHPFPDHYESVKSNCAQPPSSPGQLRGICYLVSPGGGSISKFCTPRVGLAKLDLTDALMFGKECLHIPTKLQSGKI